MRALVLVSFLTMTALAQAAVAQTSAPPEKADGPSMTAGWNSDWAMLFSLNNIFTQGNVLGGFKGLGTAGTFFLSPKDAIRTGVTLSRTSNPPVVTRTESMNGNEKVVTYTTTSPAATSVFDARVRGDFIRRFARGRISPYAGGGLNLGYNLSSLDYTDDASVVDQRTVFDHSTTRFSVGVQGVAGAEWRFHPNFALFAEYELSVSVFSWDVVDKVTTVENTRGGARSVASTREERSAPVWFTGSNSLGQGGTLGLLVFF